MDHRIVTALAVKLLRLVDLSKPRVETLSLLILAAHSGDIQRAYGEPFASGLRAGRGGHDRLDLPAVSAVFPACASAAGLDLRVNWACEAVAGMVGRPIRGSCALTGPI